MSFESIADVLGGERIVKHPIHSELDLILLSEEGVTKSALKNLASKMRLPLEAMATLLSVSARTIQRYTNSDHFNKTVSEQILQIAEVVARGEEVFGDSDRFLQWLNLPNSALADKKPFDLLDSRFGSSMILDLLGRIEQGVYS